MYYKFICFPLLPEVSIKNILSKEAYKCLHLVQCFQKFIPPYKWTITSKGLSECPLQYITSYSTYLRIKKHYNVNLFHDARVQLQESVKFGTRLHYIPKLYGLDQVTYNPKPKQSPPSELVQWNTLNASFLSPVTWPRYGEKMLCGLNLY